MKKKTNETKKKGEREKEALCCCNGYFWL